jgi:hypothetical protein
MWSMKGMKRGNTYQ